MDSLKRITVLLLAAALVYAGAAALHPPQARAGINAGVIVNNPASQPVPISGNVGINGTATVQLAAGTTVGVTGGTINFSNTPSTPIFTRDNPALAPFQTTLCLEFTNVFGNPCGGNPSSFPVGNQRLVIEFVSVLCGQSGTGSVIGSGITTIAGGNSAGYTFPIGQPNSQGVANFNQQVRIYADPGSTISLSTLGSRGSGGQIFCQATLSGNLVTP